VRVRSALPSNPAALPWTKKQVKSPTTNIQVAHLIGTGDKNLQLTALIIREYVA
jgi:hypothetical protein